MYLLSKLSFTLFLTFLLSTLSTDHHSPSHTNPQSTGTLSINLSTDVKIIKSYAEITYTYNLLSLSQEPLEIFFHLPKLQRVALLSLTATLENQVKSSLIIDPERLKPSPENTDQHRLQPSDPTRVGVLPAGQRGVVVLSVMEELEQQRGNVWSLTLASDLFVGPFIVNNEHASALERWDIGVTADSHLDLIKSSEFNQNQKGERSIEWTLLKGDANLNEDLVLKFKEKQYFSWDTILAKHTKYPHDYVVFIDFSLEKEVKSKEDVKGPINIEHVALQPMTEAIGGLPAARDEFIFVIDRSSAIKGENLQILKMMLEKTINRLPKGAFFNIVSYVSNMHFYHFQSVELTEESRKEVLSWVANLQDGSGTATINNPVRVATTMPRKERHLRTIILFSGQGVQNSDEILDFMEENSKHVRFCHINVGQQGFGNDHEDFEKTGRCMSTFVKTKQDATEKIDYLIETITNPHLEGLHFMLECFDSSNHSNYLAEEAWNFLSYGQPFRRWFHLQPAKDIDHCIGDLGFINDTSKQEYKYKFYISSKIHTDSPVWHKVAYSSLIRILSIKSREAPEGDTKHIMINHIKGLSNKYQVISDYTALVLTNHGISEFSAPPLSKEALEAEEDANLDPAAKIVMDKMFKTKPEPEKKLTAVEEELKRIEDAKNQDEFMMKIVIGLAVVISILYVLGKIFIKKYEKENAELKEEQDRLEKEFYEKFNKNKKKQ